VRREGRGRDLNHDGRPTADEISDHRQLWIYQSNVSPRTDRKRDIRRTPSDILKEERKSRLGENSYYSIVLSFIMSSRTTNTDDSVNESSGGDLLENHPSGNQLQDECAPACGDDREPSALAVSKKRTATTASNDSSAPEGTRTAVALEEEEAQVLNRVTPHMERLLRLLHDGDEAAAAAAAAQLTLLTGQSSAIVLWEILGRLCHTLLRRSSNSETSSTSSNGGSSSSWKSRQNAAMAMQGVARHLPITDQRDFMSQKVVNAVGSRNRNSKVTTATTTSTTNAGGIIPQTSTAAINSTATMANESSSTLRVQDEEQEESSDHYHPLQLSALESHIDRVLSQGRHLYATAATRYDAQQQDYEDLAVENLTTTTTRQQHQQDGNSRKSTNTMDFVQRRTRLQRQILAQRLGLGAISKAMGGAASSLCDNLLPEGIANEAAMQSLEGCTKKTAAAASKEEEDDECMKNHHQQQPLRKKRRHVLYSSGASSTVDSSQEAVGDIRALLVTEMELEHKYRVAPSTASSTGGGGDADRGSGDATAPSHRNPQELLASELIYRMFDSVWQVRHGALLGTLSILQAWRKAAASATSSSSSLDALVDDTGNGDCENDNIDTTDNNHKAAVVFGSWPEDILVRCLCILSLDRFGDFSGATAATTTTTRTDRSPQGGVVAPVRDTAAQLLSVLWTMAPLDMQTRTLDILYRLAGYSGGDWEVRHGALVALKFVTVVIGESMAMQESQMRNQAWHQDCLGNILRATIDHLNDESDDVVSVAAQTLFEIVRGQASFAFSVQVLNNANVIVAFDAGEIVNPLWSAMRTAKPYSSSIVDLVALFPVLLKIDSAAVLRAIGESSEKCGIGETVSLLWEFLGSEFESVQVSALKSMGMLSEQLATMTVVKSSKEAYSRIVDRLFAMHFIAFREEENQSTDATLGSLGSQLGFTWKRICDGSGLLFGESDDMAKQLAAKLLTRYYACVDTDSFERLLQACDALVYFLSSRRISNASSALIDMCLSAFIASPWLSLCEASCLLYRGLRARQGDHSALVNCYQSILACLFRITPLCIEIEASDKGPDTLRDDLAIKVCHDAFLEGVRMIEGGATPQDASHFATELWKETFRSRGVITQGSTERLVDMHSMRVRATMAHAVLVGGLPSKITPLVRSLVTSLKSEVGVARQLQTCTAVANLLYGLDGDVKYASAYSKIIGTVCDMATEEVPIVGKHPPATQVVHLYVSSMTNRMLHDEMNPLLSRLARIFSDDMQSTDSNIYYGVNLLRAVSSGLVKGGVSSSYFVDKYTSPLSLLSCRHVDEHVRRASFSAVKYLCHTDPTCGLRHALSTTVQQLKECGPSVIRSECFRLLKAIVEQAGMDLCPYIRSLLPFVMTLMTDPDQDNAKMANNMFAYLVRLAPLIRFHRPLFDEEIADNHSESVIDHLILGKPLPLCNVPAHISDELHCAGVSLRGYQNEGISWLRFLQTVNLNGALCDSMGLGKTLMALVGMAMAHSNQPADSRPVSLVVCPSTLVGHWVSEIERFFPSGDVLRPLGLAYSRDIERKLSNGEPGSSWNVFVTSYTLMRNNIERFRHQKWTYCILDGKCDTCLQILLSLLALTYLLSDFSRRTSAEESEDCHGPSFATTPWPSQANSYRDPCSK
jgi:SNF2-related domain/Domain of unknown function (DUF3535)